jgi:hypothetical protein
VQLLEKIASSQDAHQVQTRSLREVDEVGVAIEYEAVKVASMHESCVIDIARKSSQRFMGVDRGLFGADIRRRRRNDQRSLHPKPECF